MLLGGGFADTAARRNGWIGKLRLLSLVCVSYSLICPLLLLRATPVTLAVIGLLFLVSGFVTALGLSTIIDLVQPTRRGVATAAAFFLNVLLGAGLGPVLTPLTARWIGNPQGGFDVVLVILATLTMLPASSALLAVSRTTSAARP